MSKNVSRKLHFFMQGEKPGVAHPNLMWVPTFIYLNGRLQETIHNRVMDEFLRRHTRPPTFDEDDMDRLDEIAITVIADYAPVVGVAEYLRAMTRMRYLPSKVKECEERLTKDIEHYKMLKNGMLDE